MGFLPGFHGSKNRGERVAEADRSSLRNPARPLADGETGDRTPIESPLPKEVLRAEILDWWEGEQERVSHELSGKLQTILDQVDEKIDGISLKGLFVNRRRFVRETIEPLVVDFLEGNYREFSERMKESFKLSMVRGRGREIGH